MNRFLGAVTATLFVVTTGCASAPAPSTAPSSGSATSTGPLQPARALKTISGLAHPFSVAVDSDAVWVTEYDSGNLVRFEERTNYAEMRIALGGKASSMALGEGSVWVTDPAGATVKRVGVQPPFPVTSIALDPGADPMGIALGGGSVWVTELQRGVVVRIDPSTDRVIATIAVSAGTDGIVVVAGTVWTANRFDNTLTRIDPSTQQLTQVTTGHRASGAIAAGEDAVWVANQDGVLSRLDPRSGQVLASIEVGSPDWPAMSVAMGSVWIAAPLDNLVARVDVTTGAVTSAVTTGRRPQGLAVDGPHLWVANYDDGTVVELPA